MMTWMSWCKVYPTNESVAYFDHCI